MANKVQIVDLIYKIKKELDYIEEDLLFCDRKIPYTNKFYIGDFSVRITINELR